MKLKKNADLIRFIKTAARCRGEVLYQTAEGDRLNLKSTLSQYLFATAAGGEGFIPGGELCCELEADAELLKEFLQ
ncbi:polya polymerase [Lachnoclostridium sp. Marseille-P6806]|uniref:polya polymerase n=1 Tax=Lachnoclostridium sp. Marseille-P6806 TaxID=2364793 RepID=UPI001030C144|nr:polya polymerase [Lachnoclostridium sp. Marseille-P6806]